MNRRGFFGTALAGLSGFFFSQKADSVHGQYLVTIDVDEDRLHTILKKLGKKYIPANQRRAIEEVLQNHMGLLNRWYPNIMNIEVRSV